MCMCVDIFFCGWWMNSFAWSIFPFYFFRYGLSFSFSSFFIWHALRACGIPSFGMYLFFFSFFFFLTCLVGMWHTFFGYASFISFCITHILDGNFGERERVMEWFGVLFCGRWQCLLSFSVEVYHVSGDVYVMLIIGIWNVSHKGLQQFGKAQWGNKLHMWKVFNFEQHMALDRNFIDKWGALLQFLIIL